jgi:hypothetical protein
MPIFYEVVLSYGTTILEIEKNKCNNSKFVITSQSKAGIDS